jgi:hypothetical protein
MFVSNSIITFITSSSGPTAATPGRSNGPERNLSTCGGNKRNERTAALALLGGLGLGAAAMYLFDPARGKQRRALLGRKAVHAGHELEVAAQVSSEDLQNRALGAMAGVRSAIQPKPMTEELIRRFDEENSHRGR